MVMVVASGSVIHRHAVLDSICRSGVPLIYDESPIAEKGRRPRQPTWSIMSRLPPSPVGVVLTAPLPG